MCDDAQRSAAAAIAAIPRVTIDVYMCELE